ncbi:hypothetical protein [Colwellia sp. UCD-KL20]|uniref:hypothetical protein n=1 Tax=Colwellia sp. UCD-KL20 TaxID=1917165 RepID=UPI000970BCA5|nr:hypothetical protein [Colwellia sp. UCD-KL20]
MNINKAAALGLTGNELSKTITGSSDVTASRTAIAASSGIVLGVCASGAATVALGVASTPVTIPLAVASGLVAGIASLFD